VLRAGHTFAGLRWVSGAQRAVMARAPQRRRSRWRRRGRRRAPEGDDGRLALGCGVGRCDGGSEGRAGDAATRAEQQRLGEELGGDVAAGCAECASHSDLGAALEHGDDHHVGDPDPAAEKGDGAESEQERGVRVLGGGLEVLGTTKAASGRRVEASALYRGPPGPFFWREVVIVDPRPYMSGGQICTRFVRARARRQEGRATFGSTKGSRRRDSNPRPPLYESGALAY
jgi:hypothetical protein